MRCRKRKLLCSNLSRDDDRILIPPVQSPAPVQTPVGSFVAAPFEHGTMISMVHSVAMAFIQQLGLFGVQRMTENLNQTKLDMAKVNIPPCGDLPLLPRNSSPPTLTSAATDRSDPAWRRALQGSCCRPCP